ncbi:hypothetical protein SISSUDRAFT_623284 [Sistotremastrum suecicum HHB10207 ss-3]|uniref:Elongation factor 1 alpha-like protein n=1 Tax=Sistotremastrum suecicum HHB10207 ss-3 TaxID=1314776 RepID=A0A166EIN6_9AGAM|nr:hypothetical protein SISSUDRAFT_623284 [Sistotremastrum suecicum HHB10207 ss-3]
MAALGLQDNEMRVPEPESPKIAISKEKLMGEVRRTIEKEALEGIKSLSIVVIGHVDAGKSTLMGHLLYALGRVGDKKRIANERASEKLGKASFSWAWELDGTQEERERGVTMDVAIQSFTTPHRRCTVLDAPGHRDFIPKMISGASQADCALLVVDAAAGEFEAGFDRGGQTREHLVLVRSLGVSQVVVAINKMDQVSWSRQRYEEIMGLLQTFLMQTGFAVQRIQFVPVGAMLGVNLVDTNQPEAEALRKWYSGPTLADLLDVLTPPPRLIESPMRLPLTNVFRGQTSVASGIAVSGRLSSGIIQVGERVSVLPGDETAVIKIIEVEEESVPWAAAGSSVTLYLSGIDPVQLGIGTVLCPPSDPVPLASSFVAQIVVFDIQVPIIAGASVELFHHSRDIPATVTKLLATVERSNGTVIKANPRVLTKSVSAKIQINIRTSTMSGQAVRAMPIPLEPFHVSKELGRILLRRNGETIAAGIVLEVLD